MNPRYQFLKESSKYQTFGNKNKGISLLKSHIPKLCKFLEGNSIWNFERSNFEEEFPLLGS